MTHNQKSTMVSANQKTRGLWERDCHVYKPPSNDTFQINIENATVNVLKVTSKMLYNEFKRKKQTAPSAQKKIKLKYPNLSLEWKEIYFFRLRSHMIQKLGNFSTSC